VRGGVGTVNTFTIEDVLAIGKEVPSVLAVAPVVRASAQIVYESQNWSSNVVGTTPGYTVVRQWALADGRDFGDDDVRAAAKVCVLGQIVADQLFGGMDAVGRTIRIRNIPFRVIGVLAEKGESSFGGSQDDTVLVPWTTMHKRIERADHLRFAMMSARDASLVDDAKEKITAILRQRHHLAENDEDDFTIRSQAEFSQAADQSARIFTLLLGGIASVSLLVGGIGIMNIMLVSVTERIREIGIRMALGARGIDIMLQFLVEAIMLSLLGGGIGVALGYGLSRAASGYSDWPLVVTTDSIALAVGFAATVGIFFGFYPAVKASRLDPIQALRHE